MLYFFPPRSSFFHRLFLVTRKAGWLRNFETKTLIRSEIESTSQFPASSSSFFFPSTEIESKSKGRIIQKISSNSIIPTTEEEIVGSNIDRLIKNDILQEKRKKFDCCIVSIGDRWNNSWTKSIIDDIHSTLRFCSDFSCNEWQSGGNYSLGGKIKNQKLKFWKERERKGDGETRRWLVSENFIDSFIHGERGEGEGDSHLLHKQSNANALAVKPKARCIPAGVALIKSSSLSMALPSKFPFDRNGIPSKWSNIELCPF